ncbi:MAG: metal ABC transporter permease [Peptostreptococcaceae bacterium]|jgi:manganese/zinc/iron transport system permease protein|nr:metal ABC transporter permease [Peptostreptococcaceae bacterium]
MNFILELFNDYTFRLVLLGSILLGITSGTIGTYAVLKKEALIGDAISHAALPGIAISFILIGSKNTEILLFGAFIAGALGALLILLISKNSIIKYDNALAIILASFFGFGLVLLTYTQKIPNSNQAGLEKFLFGQVSTILKRDINIMVIICFITLFLIVLCWKELKLLCFDPVYLDTIGFSSKKIDLILTTIIVISIIVGLQTVGVILMSSMLIAPAVAARQWTDKLYKMMILSGIFAGLAGFLGTIISSAVLKMPTGPIIVLVITFIAFISIIFAPNRGLLWQKLREHKNKKEVSSNIVLNILYTLSKSHSNESHPHTIESMMITTNGKKYPKRYLKRELDKLLLSGLVDKYLDKWCINNRGIEKIKHLEYLDKEDKNYV